LRTLSAELIIIETNGQRWLTTWHAGECAPAGKPHGAAGICVTDTREIVVVSQEGTIWDFLAGRTEGDETWEQTLHREMREEACATITHAKLLGFSRGECVDGPERGLILVRSIWLAEVQLLEWEPKFEIAHRRLVSLDDVFTRLPSSYLPFWQRVLADMRTASAA
jgi:ADP-ribose pyrophosphatase YjhB (NUDIX family)